VCRCLTETWDGTTSQAGILELEAFVERVSALGQPPTPLEIVVKDLQVRLSETRPSESRAAGSRMSRACKKRPCRVVCARCGCRR
jgi:hypothetical protein